ncbi:MAG: BlaI/MecI/CopY family transcriptional regulator, partial [Oscillospiraceae bacterium]|nr:BlaI/MecI/CopY family transcriptional regulator [Oscillospiraceae bacterium]
ISDSELEVMKLLWKAGEPVTSTVIREQLQSSMGWEATTIKTLISRLVHKEVISQEKRKVFYYRPLISEREYNAWATSRLINKLYKGSAAALVAALVDSQGLSDGDIDELRALFKVED